MPKISVILPVYNAEKFVSESIKSILNQTFSDFELIILDDGSTDNSLQIIQSFKDSRIKIHCNNENLKLIATLNIGLKLAQGEYIARMDADDICDETRFEKQINYLDQNPDVVLLGTNYSIIENNNFTSNLACNNDEIYIRLYFENPICHPSVIIRNHVIRDNNLTYNSNLIHIEDWGFWMSIRKFGKLNNLKEPLLKYRISEQNITTVNRSTIEQRYKNYYAQILPEILPNINQFICHLHYQIAVGIYDGKTSISAIIKHKKELEHYFNKKNTYIQLLKIILKPKLQKLNYSIIDYSFFKGIVFGLRVRSLNLKILAYAFKSLLKSNN